MAAKKRVDIRIHAWGEPVTGALCGVRVVNAATAVWGQVTCVPCLCEIMEACKKKVERLMDAKWSGSGKLSRAGQGRKLPREQMEWDE